MRGVSAKVVIAERQIYAVAKNNVNIAKPKSFNFALKISTLPKTLKGR